MSCQIFNNAFLMSYLLVLVLIWYWRMKYYRDTCGSVRKIWKFASLKTQNVSIIWLLVVELTRNQTHFHRPANLGVPYYRTVYAKMSRFSNNSVKNRRSDLLYIYWCVCVFVCVRVCVCVCVCVCACVQACYNVRTSSSSSFAVTRQTN